METDFSKVIAAYTGGGIWLFYGGLKDGTYFLMDDYGSVLICNADTSDLDQSTYPDWQEEHKVRELHGEERKEFCINVLNALKREDDYCDRGGITDGEIKYYKHYMMKEM